jgi:hypothetical protein
MHGISPILNNKAELSRHTPKSLSAMSSIVSWSRKSFDWLRWLILATVLLNSSLATTTASEEERFVQGLRDRRLFRLAEQYCRQRLASESLTSEQRALLVTELLRTYAGHAVNSRVADRESLWQQARETSAAFAREHANNPRGHAAGR